LKHIEITNQVTVLVVKTMRIVNIYLTMKILNLKVTSMTDKVLNDFKRCFCRPFIEMATREFIRN